MRSNALLQLVIFLSFSILVKCQFEFNDLRAVHGILADMVQEGQVNCLAVLRPTNPNPKEKSAIDQLTSHLAKDISSKDGIRRPTVMAYTTELYEKHYMDPNQRIRDGCIFGGVVVMASDSTNAQLARLSSDTFNFESTYWMVFVNRTDYAPLLQNVRIRLSTRLWVTEPKGNGLFNLTEIGMFGNKVGSLGFVLWAKDGGVVGGSEERHAKMTRHTVTVGTLQNGPYTSLKRNKSGEITLVTGFYGEIWNDLQETLMFNSVFLTPKDETFGTVNANGNWTGLYGMIVGKQVDVLLGGMTISETRYQIVDFLHAIQKTKYKIFYKKEADLHDWFKVFRPLDNNVWIALVVWIVVGGTVAYFVTMVVRMQPVKNDISWMSCMYFVFRTLCNQGLDQVPKPWALRIFLITAYLHATLIVTSYSASLISVLTVKTPVEPFTALPDIRGTDYKLILNSNSTDYDFFAKTTDHVHREIYETSIIKTQHFGGYFKAMKTACENSKTGFFGKMSEVAVVYSRSKLPCVLLPLRSEISPAYESIAVAKHSQYREILNRRLFRMIEHGLVNRYRLLYMPDSYETSLENEIGIGLIDVGAVFIYLIILETLSVGIFTLELLSRKYQLYIKKGIK